MKPHTEIENKVKLSYEKIQGKGQKQTVSFKSVTGSRQVELTANHPQR